MHPDSFSYVSRRPNMGLKQVLSPDELQPGHIYTMHRRIMTPGRTVPGTVLKEPGEWYEASFVVLRPPESDAVTVQYQIPGKKKGTKDNIWLVHAGVIPNQVGQYHRYNWVEDPDK